MYKGVFCEDENDLLYKYFFVRRCNILRFIFKLNVSKCKKVYGFWKRMSMSNGCKVLVVCCLKGCKVLSV